jgi:hypothetical protein
MILASIGHIVYASRASCKHIWTELLDYSTKFQEHVYDINHGISFINSMETLLYQISMRLHYFLISASKVIIYYAVLDQQKLSNHLELFITMDVLVVESFAKAFNVKISL